MMKCARAEREQKNKQTRRHTLARIETIIWLRARVNYLARVAVSVQHALDAEQLGQIASFLCARLCVCECA